MGGGDMLIMMESNALFVKIALQLKSDSLPVQKDQ